MIGRIVLSLTILAVSLGDQRASADPAAAKTHQERGRRLYTTQDYDGAIQEWRAAYVLVPDPDLLFAIGQAQRLKGDCGAALVTYRNVLKEKVGKKQIAEVEKVIALCEEALKTAAPPAPVPAPVPAPAPTPTSPPTVAMPTVSPSEPPAPIADTPSHGRWYKDKLGMTLLAGGVIGMAIGTTFFVLARNAESDADAATSYEEYGKHAETAKRDRVLAGVSGGVGGALVIGAIVRFATRSSTVQVTTTAGGTGGTGLAIGGRW